MLPLQTKSDLSNQIRIIRNSRGFSRKRLAREFGHRTSSTIAHWETGLKTPTLRSAIKLIRILNVSVEQLFPHLVWEVDDEIQNTHR
ncbi:XRE family transcriptional regulator [bacterium]|nr:MAG: XRE family transcriptional regulator [bacterium]